MFGVNQAQSRQGLPCGDTSASLPCLDVIESTANVRGLVTTLTVERIDCHSGGEFRTWSVARLGSRCPAPNGTNRGSRIEPQ